MARFHKHVVLITGASAGIGAEMARQFALEGADVVLTARRLERLRELAAEIEAMGGRALPLACDVTVDGDWQRVVEATHEAFGPIDVAIANAGFGVSGLFERLTLDDYRRQMDTNVYGVLRTAYATLDDLKKKRGRLVVVSSVNGYVTFPETSPYAMSKYAVRAFCESITGELANHGVSVTMISPGFVASDIRRTNNSGKVNENAKDFVPSFLVMPTPIAARKIVDAVFKRKREKIITFHGWFMVQLSRWTPWLLHLANRWIGRKAFAKRRKRDAEKDKLQKSETGSTER